MSRACLGASLPLPRGSAPDRGWSVAIRASLTHPRVPRPRSQKARQRVRTCVRFARDASLSRMSITPPASADDTGSEIHATRRGAGGARRGAADRVLLRSAEQELTGWALNVSRGGVRLIVEDPAPLGPVYAVTLGSDDAPPREARVIWVQEEPDGLIVGLEFIDAGAESMPPLPPAVSVRKEQ
jgi:hypothetical protein